MVKATAAWWKTDDFTLEAPWGMSVDFDFELVDEGIISDVKVEATDETTDPVNRVAKLTLESADGSLDLSVRKHQDLLRRLRRWQAKALKKEYQEPSWEEAWLSLLLWRQSSSKELSLIKSVILGTTDAEDEVTKILHRKIRQDNSGRVRRQVVIPNDDKLVPLLMKKYHQDRAHVGISGTLQAMLKVVWWKDIRKNVRDYVRSCQVCQLIGDVHVHCPSGGEAETFYASSTICDLNAVESVGLSSLSPMLSKMTDKESNWQAKKGNPTSLSPRRSKESIIKLFEATITEAINGGWVTLHEHYSYYFEDTVGGKEKVRTLFGCDFMNEVNDNQCNAQAINDKFKVEGETYLPACVQQLRRKGLDGTTNSISVGQDGVNHEVSSPLVEPAVVGCIMAICMCWRLTMSEGIEAFLGGCRGVCFRQCWLCAPWVKVKKDGSQLATTCIGRESDGEEWVNHCDTEEHTYKEYMLRIYGLSFLGITQAMVEGARWTYELAYETWNSQGSKLATNKCDREGPLSEGKYMPASKHLRCLVCIDSTKTPASDWQLSAHWSGGFGSKKETQHSYYIKRAFYEANYVGSRTDPRFCYLEGRPPLISNKNVSKNPTWMSTWKKCSDLGLGYTALTLRLVKEPVFKALNEIVGRVCGAATVDLQQFSPSTEDPISYEALDIGSISPLVDRPDKGTPTTSPSKSNNFF
ncbi:hypothetical protein FOZ62_027231, partial [Perkinsus olseni]